MNQVLIIGMSPILGGVETYIYNLIKYIDKTKYQFDFLVTASSKKSVFEDEINQLIHAKRNHFYYCPDIKKNYLKTRKWLKKFYNSHHYDLIYLNTCTSAKVSYCEYAIRKKNILLLSHSHSGFGFSKLNNALFRKYISKKSIFKLACSDVAAKWLFGSCDESIYIVPNGIDTKRFSFNTLSRKEIRSRHNIPDEKVVLGHVGRFIDTKNHNFFIELSKNLGSQYHFLLLGDGELKKTFVETVIDEGIRDRFTILPSMSDVEKYYSAMDIFVMPSIYEGLPIVAVEAQTNGLSCILSSDISRQTDLTGHCCFLDITNAKPWIEYIISHDFTRYDGCTLVEKAGFGVNVTVDMISDLFDKALKNK